MEMWLVTDILKDELFRWSDYYHFFFKKSELKKYDIF